jgi:hypothetical protein
VNASLWRTFLELRQEWLFRSQIPNTDIYNLTSYFTKIDDRINYWYSVLESTGIDDMRLRALIADKINEEFFTKEKCKEWQETCKLPDNIGYFYTMALCARFLMRCDFNAWYWFYLDTDYYLAVPKAYAARYTESTSQVDILKACGFSPYGVNMIDPLQINPVQNLNLAPIEDSIVPMLKSLFLSDKRFLWSLFMEGHGCCHKVDRQYMQRMVGVTVEKFKEVCQWFNANLSVHAVWIKSCSAGGMNRVSLQSDAQGFHFPFIIESLGDFFTKTIIDVDILYPKKNPLFYCTRNYIRKGPGDKWELWYDHSEIFTNFFEALHSLHDDSKAIQERVYDASEIMTPGPILQNTPYLLLPYSDKWLLCCPSHRTYIDVQAALLFEIGGMPHLLNAATVFIDAPVLKAGLKVIGKRVDYIVLINPGSSSYYVGPVDASEMKIDEFVKCFWPVALQQFTKQLLFESVICQCNPEDLLIKMLGVTEKTVVFKDVLMRIVKNEQIELVFTAPNGDVFYATYREVDGKPMVRNLQKLSATATASYRTYYDKTKTELLAKTDEAYAPLRNHYLQAMKKDQKQEQAAVA